MFGFPLGLLGLSGCDRPWVEPAFSSSGGCCDRGDQRGVKLAIDSFKWLGFFSPVNPENPSPPLPDYQAL
ncbi:hypothetical protein [Laspinema olomoucense]|nr:MULTISPECIES: hypothetical protein [unclassified Laspinema]MCT7974087.1 hypothetical protein [Laspinema sp. D3d]MCT7991843.1 hypothetical protein [Laspinema sp. D3a]MCT7997283.1 hypothetical protein [Laspinema sp. D3c]